MMQDKEGWRHADVFDSKMKGLPKEWIVFFSTPSQTRRILAVGEGDTTDFVVEEGDTTCFTAAGERDAQDTDRCS
jgi:hypothetical protein